MAEATIEGSETAQAAALERAAREIDRARMRQLGSFHFAMVIGALTIWGAAQNWAQSTGSALAGFAAIGGALVAGFVIPSTIHEWGHFAGARLSGAHAPVLEEARRHFFVFDFPMDRNDVRQFTWMSWGGILAPWGVVLLAAIFVPLSVTSGAVLLATLFSRAVGVSVFEVPVVQAVGRGVEPAVALGQHVKGGGLTRGRKLGTIAGFACFALLWLAA